MGESLLGELQKLSVRLAVLSKGVLDHIAVADARCFPNAQKSTLQMQRTLMSGCAELLLEPNVCEGLN